MRASLRTIKRSLPDPWQRVIEWTHGALHRVARLEFPTDPKWDYLLWLASGESPPRPFVRSAPLPLRSAFILSVYSATPILRVYLPPPQTVKVRVIRTHARRFGIRTFVETGTFKGETIAAVADAFDRRITIELSTELWRKARERLPGVECLLGDSSAVLKHIVPLLNNPALFWLDAHASGGDTIDSGVGPIFEELQTIFASGKPHVILIDDARGHQVEAIEAVVPESHSFSIRNDIIRITPRHSS
jgi:hypothetical protein